MFHDGYIRNGYDIDPVMQSRHDSPPLKPAVFHVLLALAEGATHGYGAMQAVREQSGGRVAIGTASFYDT